MLKRLVTVLTIAAFASATVAATPVQAKDDDLAKLLVGAAALFVIAKTIDNNKKKKKRHGSHKPKPDKYAGKRLPGACLKRYQTEHGTERHYSAWCLESKFKNADNLPERCWDAIWTTKGYREVYRPRCLTRSGYRIASAR